MLEKLRDFFNYSTKNQEPKKPYRSALDMILEKAAKIYAPTDLSWEQIAEELRTRRVVGSDEEIRKVLLKVEAVRQESVLQS